MTHSATTTTVRRQVLVNAPISEAFKVFTERFGDFKPREHNMLQVPIAETVFEQRVTGLPPGIGVVSVIRDPTGTEQSGPGLGVVPPSGEWHINSSDTWRAERGEPLGEYTAMIKTIDGTTTLATATFIAVTPLSGSIVA